VCVCVCVEGGRNAGLCALTLHISNQDNSSDKKELKKRAHACVKLKLSIQHKQHLRPSEPPRLAHDIYISMYPNHTHSYHNQFFQHL
jgi:hypothetical protein